MKPQMKEWVVNFWMSDFGNSHSIENAQDGLEAAAQFVTRNKAKYANAQVLVTTVGRCQR